MNFNIILTALAILTGAQYSYGDVCRNPVQKKITYKYIEVLNELKYFNSNGSPFTDVAFFSSQDFRWVPVVQKTEKFIAPVIPKELINPTKTEKAYYITGNYERHFYPLELPNVAVVEPNIYAEVSYCIEATQYQCQNEGPHSPICDKTATVKLPVKSLKLTTNLNQLTSDFFNIMEDSHVLIESSSYQNINQYAPGEFNFDIFSQNLYVDMARELYQPDSVTPNPPKYFDLINSFPKKQFKYGNVSTVIKPGEIIRNIEVIESENLSINKRSITVVKHKDNILTLKISGIPITEIGFRIFRADNIKVNPNSFASHPSLGRYQYLSLASQENPRFNDFQTSDYGFFIPGEYKQTDSDTVMATITLPNEYTQYKQWLFNLVNQVSLAKRDPRQTQSKATKGSLISVLVENVNRQSNNIYVNTF